MFQAGAHSSTPSHFPLIYGQGDFFDILNPQRLFVLGHAAAAMFLPSGHTAAQAAAMGSLQVLSQKYCTSQICQEIQMFLFFLIFFH